MKKPVPSLLSGALALLIAAPLALPVAAASFSDMTSSHWASSFVSVAVGAELMGGTEDNKFHPDENLTYGEFAVVIVNGAYSGETQASASDSHWSDPFLNVLLDKGMFKDGQNVNVAPTSEYNWQDKPILREDAATVVARVLERGNFDIGDMSLVRGLGDTDSLSDGQKQDLADVMTNEVMVGSEGQFGVGNSLTRAEATVIIKTMLERYALTNRNGMPYTANSSTDTSTPSTDSTTDTTTDSETSQQAVYVAEVFRLVNLERANVGLAPLAWNDALMQAAQFKSDEMKELGYFDHDSPVYGGFSGIIRLFLTNYGGAGENIARGQSSPAAVMSSWMNSSGHKANILKESYTQIGIGYANGYWTQQFTATAGTPVGGSTSTTVPDSTTSTTTPDSSTTPDTGTFFTSGSANLVVTQSKTGWNNDLGDGTYPYAFFESDVSSSGGNWVIFGNPMAERVYDDAYITNTVIGEKELYIKGHSALADRGQISISQAQYNLTIDTYILNSKVVAYQGDTRIELTRTGTDLWRITDMYESFYPYYLTSPVGWNGEDDLVISQDVLTQATIDQAKQLKDSGYDCITLEITIIDGVVTKAVAASSPTYTGSSSNNTGTTTPETTTPNITTPDTTTPDTTTPDTSTPETSTPSTGTTTTPDSSSNLQEEYVAEVFRLVNEERANAGVSPLIWYDDLMDAAQFKSAEMNELNYFDHTSPVYGYFTGIMKLFVDLGQCYHWAENCAMGQRTPEEVMNSWMNSSGHKANILDSRSTHIGIGFDGYYWTQQFVGMR